MSKFKYYVFKNKLEPKFQRVITWELEGGGQGEVEVVS